MNGNKIAGGNPERGRVEHDYYATHPDSVRALLKVEEIVYPAFVWEKGYTEKPQIEWI